MASPLANLPGFDTPEAAAMSTFPPQYVRVAASRNNGRDAFVLLDTGSPGQPYHYGVNCHCHDGLWYEGSSSNGYNGWSATGDAELGLGMVMCGSEVGPGVDCVRVEYGSEVVDVAVENGVYLAVWFDRPRDMNHGPRIAAYRQHGEWKPYEGWQWY